MPPERYAPRQTGTPTRTAAAAGRKPQLHRQHALPAARHSRRNLYYYLEFFRDCGFIVEKHGQCYSIDRSSPFFSRLFHRVAFSETEAVALRQLLSQADSHNAVLEGISRKLDRFYDFDILANDERRQRNARHVGVIYQAIKLRQMAVLKGYSSPHSQSQRDRVVEPFLLMKSAIKRVSCT